jgi:hypothetical protein
MIANISNKSCQCRNTVYYVFIFRAERKLFLPGTGVLEAVNKDIQNITKEFNDVVLPYIKSHTDLFGYGYFQLKHMCVSTHFILI